MKMDILSVLNQNRSVVLYESNDIRVETTPYKSEARNHGIIAYIKNKGNETVQIVPIKNQKTAWSFGYIPPHDSGWVEDDISNYDMLFDIANGKFDIYEQMSFK